MPRKRPILAPSPSPLSPDVDLRREHLRLHRVFATLVFALAQACAPAGPPRGGATSGGVEAGVDAGAETDAPLLPDADAAQPEDAGASDSCAPVLSQADAGADAAADAEPICFYTLPCGLPPGFTTGGCDVYQGAGDAAVAFGCSLVEGEGCVADAAVPGDGGAVTIACPGCLGGGGGRRPRGLVRSPALRAPTALGAYFASMAYDEAASVHAFRRLRDELALHGAPSALVVAAARSVGDEEQHASLMAHQARAHGATVRSPRVRRGPPRSLETIARENAVEGCVHETFGALVLAWQAAHAPGAALRRSFQRLAADEARHAALSWAVAGWAEARLDPAARARVSAARGRAVRALRRAGGSAFDAAVGRPHPAERVALVDGLVRQLDLG